MNDSTDLMTDTFGMAFYVLTPHRFKTHLDPFRYVKRYNKLSRHKWTERVRKDNADSIDAEIERQYKKWEASLVTAKWYETTMPRTPRETRMIQAQIDGNAHGWWNIC